MTSLVEFFPHLYVNEVNTPRTTHYNIIPHTSQVGAEIIHSTRVRWPHWGADLHACLTE